MTQLQLSLNPVALGQMTQPMESIGGTTLSSHLSMVQTQITLVIFGRLIPPTLHNRSLLASGDYLAKAL